MHHFKKCPICMEVVCEFSSCSLVKYSIQKAKGPDPRITFRPGIYWQGKDLWYVWRKVEVRRKIFEGMPSTIKIFRTDGTIIEGTLFAADPVTNSLVVQTSNEYQMICQQQIAKIEGDMCNFAPPDAPISLIK